MEQYSTKLDAKMSIAPHFLIGLLFTAFMMVSGYDTFAQKFVKATATGSGTGTNWDNAIGASGLKAAIEAGGTIYIAAGTYNPASTMNLNSPSTFKIVGGFAASAAGTSLSSYNPAVNQTVISASGMSAGLKRVFASTSNDIELKGLVLQDGSQGTTGGALYVITGKVLKFSDLVVKNNTAGGIGVYSVTGATASVSFTNCIFQNNTNTGNGGALVCSTVYETADPITNTPTPGKFTMSGCSFANNTSNGQGGAIEFTTSHAWEISNTCFSGNSAYLAGGVIFTTSKKNILTGCNFTGNSATTAEGGAMIATTATATLTNCNFVSNTAIGAGSGYGGAIFATTASLTMSGTNFYDNTAKAGGAIYSTTWANNIRSTAANCIFSNNEATNTTGTVTGTNGGGAIVINANANGWDFTNSKFVNNKVPTNGWGGAISHYDSETTIDNCIFYNNTKGGSATISGSDIKNYDNAGHFNSITNSSMQLANAAAYTNQADVKDATAYNFGTGVTFSNVTDPAVAASPSITCPIALAAIASITTNTPPTQTATSGQSKTGNAAMELMPTGAISPYTYSNGVGESGCVAPSGATLLPGLTVLASGSYSYTAPSIAGTYYYCIKVCDASNPAVCSVTTYSLTVSPPSAAGGAAAYMGVLPICATSNIGTVRVTGYSGTGIAKWQTSFDGTIWSDIAGTSGKDSYNFSNAVNNQQYRAVVSQASAADAFSIPVVITVSTTACTVTNCDNVTGGFSVGNVSQATGSNLTNVVILTNGSGVIQYVSANNANSFTNVISGNYLAYQLTYDNTQTPLPILTVGTNVSAIGGACIKYSNQIAYKVCIPVCSSPSVGGTVTYSGQTPLCNTGNTGTVTLSGQTGNVVKWQTSTDGGTVWTDIVSNSTSYTFTNAANGQRYRAVVSNGVACADANATPVIISTSASGCVGSFTFNCATASSSGIFYSNGVAGQTGTLTLPITNAVGGTVALTINLAGSGFNSDPSPYTTLITNGQTSIVIPITFNGTGSVGPRTLVVTSTNSTGSCTPTVPILGVPDLVTTIGQPATGLTVGVSSGLPVTVANQGNALASGPINTTVSLPAGVTAPVSFMSNGWNCNTTGSVVACSSPANIGIAGNSTFEVPVTPNASILGTRPTFNANTAPVATEAVTNNNAATPTQMTNPVVGAADLTTSIGQPSPTLTAGQTSNIPVTVANIGSAPSIGQITTTVTLPTGLTAPASFVSNGWSCNTTVTVVGCTNSGPINNGSSSSFNVPVTPTAATIGTTQTINATTNPVTNEVNTGNNAATPLTTPTVNGLPDMTTTLGQPSPTLVAGITSNLPVTVANIGTGGAPGPIITSVSLPTGVTAPASFSTNGWNCITTGQTVACTSVIGFANGFSSVINVPITPNASIVGTTPTFNANTAPVVGEVVTNNNAAAALTATTAVAGIPDLTTTIGTPSPALVAGQAGTLPVTVANIGTGPATGPITTKINLPSGVTSPASFNDNGWSCTNTNSVVTCINPGPINSGTSSLINVPVTPNANTAGGTQPFTAITTPVTNETSTANNTSPTTNVPITGSPDLTTSIGQPNPSMMVGQTSNIPVTVSNVGTAPTTGIITTEFTLPAGVTAPSSFANNNWSCNTTGSTVRCTNSGPITNGTATTFNIPVTPNATTIGTTPVFNANTLPVTGETNTGNNAAAPMTPSSPVMAVTSPDLVMSIGQPTPSLVANQTSNLPVTVSNVGTAAAGGPLEVTVNLPAGVNAPSVFINNGWSCTTTNSVVACNTSAGLTNGNATTFNIPITPNATIVGTSPIFNGKVAPIPGESSSTNNTAAPTTASTPVAATPAPDLTTTIGQPSPTLTVNQPSILPVVVANVGTATAAGPINTTITLPAGVTAPAAFATNGWGCQTTNSIVACNTNTAIPNGTSSTINVPITPTAATVNTSPVFNANTAPIAGETQTGNNAAQPLTPSSPVAPQNTPDLTTSIGQPLTPLVANVASDIPVTVSNIGTATTNGIITTTIALPLDVTTPNSFVSNGWSCNLTSSAGGNSVICRTTNPINSAASSTFNIPVTPNAAAIGASPVFNANTSPTNGEVVTNNNAATPMTPNSPVQSAPIPDMAISIDPVTTQMVQGTATNLLITVDNIGTASNTGTMTVVLDLPLGFTAPNSFVRSGWGCNSTASEVTCRNANPLASGSSRSFTIPVTPGPTAANTTPKFDVRINQVPTETLLANNSASTTATLPVLGLPDLTTTVGQPLTPLVIGQASNIPVTVANIGTGIANGPLTTTLNLPVGTTAPATFTDNGWNCATTGLSVACTTTTGIAPNANSVIKVPVTPNATTANTPLTFTAQTSPVSGEPNTANNTSPPTTTPNVGGIPDITTTIGQPLTPFSAGTPSDVPITVANIGSSPANGPIVTSMTLPTGTTAPANFTSGPWTCATTGITVACTSTTAIPNGGSSVITVPVTPNASTIGTRPSFTATTSPVTGETITANNPATPMTPTQAVIGVPDLTTTIGQPLPVLTANLQSILPVTVANIGTAVANGPISTTLTLPTGVTSLVNFSTNGWNCTTVGSTVNCSTSASIANNTSSVLSIPITPNGTIIGTSPVFNATTDPVPGETNTINNPSGPTPTVTPVQPTPAPDLTTTVTVPTTPPTVGSPLLVTVTVANVGNLPASASPLTATVTIPSGTTAPPTFTSNGWNCATVGSTVNCTTNNSIPGPGSVDIIVPVTPSAANVGSPLTINATTTPIAGESNSTNNNATPASTPNVQTGAPDLTTTLSQPSPSMIVGIPSNMTVTVANIGGGNAAGPISTSITLPTGVTSLANFTNNGWTCATTGQTVACTTASNIAGNSSNAFVIPVTALAGSQGTTPTFNATTAPVTGETITNNNGTSLTPTQAVVGAPDLTTTIGQPAPSYTVGVTSNIPVTVANIGSAPANGPITTTVVLGAGLSTPQSTFTSNGWNCSASVGIPQTVTCTNQGTINNGGNSIFLIPVIPAANTAGTSPTVNASTAPVTNESVTANNTAPTMTPNQPVNAGGGTGITLSIKAFLQGAMANSTVAGLMRDDLRTKNVIPAVEPYTALNYTHLSGGGETIASPTTVFGVTGANAIVDWVVVELRSALNPAQILATKSALIQRDGDVVGIDGVSAVSFTGVPSGTNAYVALRHRNHLGVMTDAAVTLTATTPLVDFTSTSVANYKFPIGNIARSSAPQIESGGVKMMWAGNTNGDNSVIFQGPDNDSDPIFFDVLFDANNGVNYYTNYIRNNVYSKADIDMDGKVIFQGPNNEVDFLFFAVLFHPDNSVNYFLNFIVKQQLP